MNLHHASDRINKNTVYPEYVYHFGSKIEIVKTTQSMTYDAPSPPSDPVYVGPDLESMEDAESTITCCDIVRSKICCCRLEYLTIESKT